jgi:hypothetical protein
VGELDEGERRTVARGRRVGDVAVARVALRRVQNDRLQGARRPSGLTAVRVGGAAGIDEGLGAHADRVGPEVLLGGLLELRWWREGRRLIDGALLAGGQRGGDEHGRERGPPPLPARPLPGRRFLHPHSLRELDYVA